MHSTEKITPKDPNEKSEEKNIVILKANNIEEVEYELHNEISDKKLS